MLLAQGGARFAFPQVHPHDLNLAFGTKVGPSRLPHGTGHFLAGFVRKLNL